MVRSRSEEVVMFLAAFDTLVEERIQKAMEEGQFRNLPGEGKPINLTDYDFLNQDVWMSNKILKNAGYLPPWVELAWDIEGDQQRLAAVNAEYDAWLESTRGTLLPLKQSERAVGRTAIDRAFHAHVEQFVRVAEPLHEKITNFNVMCPIRRLEKVTVWVEYRVEQMEERYAALCEEVGWVAPAVQPVTQARKQAQRERDELRSRHVLDLLRTAATMREIAKAPKMSLRPGKGWREKLAWLRR